MTYQMHLAEDPFNLILLGKKVIEMRLLTPEREKIKPGDYIEFTNQKNNQKLLVLVLKIDRFTSFEELYDQYDHRLLGYNTRDEGKADDMLLYYQKENIQKYGVMAIHIQVVKKV